jgi:hypothetical protein
MVHEISKIGEMGKELGLSKKDIIKILLFDNSKHAYLWRILFIITLLLIIIGWFSSLGFLIQKANQNVYATGTLYSTVRTKDFQKKYRKK